MDEAPERKSADSPYLKLPWPLVAGALLAVLAVALAGGLLANRYLRPQVNGAPTATALPVAAATAAQPLAAPIQPTSTALPVAPPTTTATAGPTAAAQAVPTGTPAPEPTVEPALAADVGRAYEIYWRVRGQALLNLDPTHLDEVMDAEHLEIVQRRIEELKVEGRAIKTVVHLNYNVIEADAMKAVVVDHIDDDSYYVKAGTEQPLTEPASGVMLAMFRLDKSSGVWKVVSSGRAP